MLGLLEAAGITLPSRAYIVAILLFSVIGMVLFWRGRRRKQQKIKWIGLALMLYPYVVWGTVPVYVVGVVLCLSAAWYWRTT
jgi:hypothetical protein